MWSYFLNRVTCLVKADSNSERQTGWGGGVGGTSERAYKRDKINVTEMGGGDSSVVRAPDS